MTTAPRVSKVTYIWIDGDVPKKVRSKELIIATPQGEVTIDSFPIWGYDGSSTYQAIGSDSDLILKPVRFIADTIRGGDNFLVLNEVYKPDGTPHPSNTRALLRHVMENGGAEQDPWIGYEQEYTLFQGSKPMGWPDGGYPAPQGPFYCGVGANEVFGRELIDAHTEACMEAGIMLYGTNAEVMPGQWEFQVGYRDVPGETADPLTVADHLWLARWMLYRIGEEFGISVSLHPKPVKGDWNGAGKHTNFSTKATRDPQKGMQAIKAAVEALSKRHNDHIKVYGTDLAMRLTGAHETAPMHEFSSGVANRGCSVRIPRSVHEKGYGYFEDRRPGANADPYEVAAALVMTVCGVKKPEKITD